MRTKKNLSRRWMKALQTTATNTAVKVKELERLEDDDYQQFLKNQGKYVEPGNGILPWQQERYSDQNLVLMINVAVYTIQVITIIILESLIRLLDQIEI